MTPIAQTLLATIDETDAHGRKLAAQAGGPIALAILETLDTSAVVRAIVEEIEAAGGIPTDEQIDRLDASFVEWQRSCERCEAVCKGTLS